jgi:hypothetical protein
MEKSRWYLNLNGEASRTCQFPSLSEASSSCQFPRLTFHLSMPYWVFPPTRYSCQFPPLSEPSRSCQFPPVDALLSIATDQIFLPISTCHCLIEYCHRPDITDRVHLKRLPALIFQRKSLHRRYDSLVGPNALCKTSGILFCWEANSLWKRGGIHLH